MPVQPEQAAILRRIVPDLVQYFEMASQGMPAEKPMEDVSDSEHPQQCLLDTALSWAASEEGEDNMSQDPAAEIVEQQAAAMPAHMPAPPEVEEEQGMPSVLFPPVQSMPSHTFGQAGPEVAMPHLQLQSQVQILQAYEQLYQRYMGAAADKNPG